ncbi:hypothetical protein MMC13_001314 [Lambiella insularis]|nr:hypothetical protein [Lambiella insularis]
MSLVKDSSSIRTALTVVCNAPVNVLISYRVEVLLALQTLHAVVGNDTYNNLSSILPEPRNLFSASVVEHESSRPRPTGHTSHDSLSLDGHNSTSPICTNDDAMSLGEDNSLRPLQSSHSSLPADSSPPKDSSSKLINALDEDSTIITNYLSQSADNVVHDRNAWVDEDPRIVDLRMDGGRSSPDTKFRKGLSQRSLAREYSQWELDSYGVSRVDELARDQSLSWSRKGGHLDEYLELNKLRFHDTPAIRSGITHGIKLLTFERVFGEAGISAVLIFRYRLVRQIKYTELVEELNTKVYVDSAACEAEIGQWMALLSGPSCRPSLPGASMSRKRPRLSHNVNTPLHTEPDRLDQDQRVSYAYSQPPAGGTYLSNASAANDTLQVVAESTTALNDVSRDFPTDSGSCMIRVNDFDISAGHGRISQAVFNDTSFASGSSSFDISANRTSFLRSDFSSTALEDEVNDFDISANHARFLQAAPDATSLADAGNSCDILGSPTEVVQQPSLHGFPFAHGVNNFDISAGQTRVSQSHPLAFADGSNDSSVSQIGVSQGTTFDSTSTGMVNHFDIPLAFFYETSSTTGETEFQQLVQPSSNQQSTSSLQDFFLPPHPVTVI